MWRLERRTDVDVAEGQGISLPLATEEMRQRLWALDDGVLTEHRARHSGAATDTDSLLTPSEQNAFGVAHVRGF